jgi:Flp pilus assembly protein TadD
MQKASAEKDKEDQSETYRVCLVRLQDKLFFDSEFVSKNFGARSIGANDLGGSVATNHMVGRLWLEKDILRLNNLDSKWIRDNMPDEFRQMQGQSAVITATTAALRQFVTEHAEDQAVWTSSIYLCRPTIDCELRVTEDKLARDPDDADVLEGAAAFYITRGDYPKAVSLLRRAVELKPAEASAHGYLALALGYQRDFEGARRELAAAHKLETDPENQGMYTFFIGFSYFLEGRYHEAALFFSAFRAKEKKPQAAAILFQYFALLRAGRAKEAKALLSKETDSFAGSREDQLLLLQAAGRVTDPAWQQMGEDSKSDVLMLYAENCLAQGDVQSARAALEFILRKPGEDLVNQLAARIELERLPKEAKDAKSKAKK